MLLQLFFSPRRLLLLSAIASALILSGALIGQYGFDWYPCELCILQRYPYVAIIVIGLIGAFFIRSERMRGWLAVLCMLLFMVDAGIAFYHAGVEWGIFTGPSGCSSTDTGEMTLEEMRAAIMNAPLVSCDQAMAHIFGLSLAAWNALAAGGMALFMLAVFIKMARWQGFNR